MGRLSRSAASKRRPVALVTTKARGGVRDRLGTSEEACCLSNREALGGAEVC